MMTKIQFLTAIFFLLFQFTLNLKVVGQKVVQLTRLSDNKTILIGADKRVIYRVNGETKGQIGILQAVGDSSLTIDGKTVPLAEFDFFGKRKKGSGFWSGFLIMFGTGVVVDALMNSDYDPCPSCIDEGSSGDGWKFVSAGIGMGIAALGVNTSIKNSVRDVKKKWKMEIVSITP